MSRESQLFKTSPFTDKQPYLLLIDLPDSLELTHNQLSIASHFKIFFEQLLQHAKEHQLALKDIKIAFIVSNLERDKRCRSYITLTDTEGNQSSRPIKELIETIYKNKLQDCTLATPCNCFYATTKHHLDLHKVATISEIPQNNILTFSSNIKLLEHINSQNGNTIGLHHYHKTLKQLRLPADQQHLIIEAGSIVDIETTRAMDTLTFTTSAKYALSKIISAMPYSEIHIYTHYNHDYGINNLAELTASALNNLGYQNTSFSDGVFIGKWQETPEVPYNELFYIGSWLSNGKYVEILKSARWDKHSLYNYIFYQIETQLPYSEDSHSEDPYSKNPYSVRLVHIADDQRSFSACQEWQEDYNPSVYNLSNYYLNPNMPYIIDPTKLNDWPVQPTPTSDSGIELSDGPSEKVNKKEPEPEPKKRVRFIFN